MKLLCPACREPITADNVNVATDLAKCTRCNELHRASALVAAAEPVGTTPPAGSTLRFAPEGVSGGVITVPRQGMGWGDTFLILFATTWTVFIAFWTFMAAHASILFASFSTIFWFVGIGMWYGILTKATERQELRIERDCLRLTRRSIVRRRHLEIPVAEISAIKLQQVARQTGNAGYAGDGVVTICYGAKTATMAEYVSEAEAQWLVGLLKSLLFARTGKMV